MNSVKEGSDILASFFGGSVGVMGVRRERIHPLRILIAECIHAFPTAAERWCVHFAGDRSDSGLSG